SSNRVLTYCCRGVEYGLSDPDIIATVRAAEQKHPFARTWTDAEIALRIRDAEKRATRGSANTSKFRLSDVGNAQRFAAQHGGNVRFCHVWRKWLTWDGRRWRRDDSGEVMRLAKQTACSIYLEAAAAPEKEEREAVAKWAAASERRERLSAMIALA